MRARFWKVVNQTRTWIIVPIAIIAFLALWNINRTHREATVNRQIIQRQARIIEKQSDILSYLCETNLVQSEVYSQLHLIVVKQLRDRTLSPVERQTLRARLELYGVAKTEFAKTRACQGLQ